tara:strand:+ start:3616 stop:3882 length:267 start_codon:yes stop_codon:yes gene_type:complete
MDIVELLSIIIGILLFVWALYALIKNWSALTNGGPWGITVVIVSIILLLSSVGISGFDFGSVLLIPLAPLIVLIMIAIKQGSLDSIKY